MRNVFIPLLVLTFLCVNCSNNKGDEPATKAPALKPEVRTDSKPEVKAETVPEAKAEPKTEVKPSMYQAVAHPKGVKTPDGFTLYESPCTHVQKWCDTDCEKIQQDCENSFKESLRDCGNWPYVCYFIKDSSTWARLPTRNKKLAENYPQNYLQNDLVFPVDKHSMNLLRQEFMPNVVQWVVFTSGSEVSRPYETERYKQWVLSGRKTDLVFKSAIPGLCEDVTFPAGAQIGTGFMNHEEAMRAKEEAMNAAVDEATKTEKKNAETAEAEWNTASGSERQADSILEAAEQAEIPVIDAPELASAKTKWIKAKSEAVELAKNELAKATKRKEDLKKKNKEADAKLEEAIKVARAKFEKQYKR